MKLDKDNYEAWLLDRMEGRLGPEELQQLEAFLSAHPELPADLGEWPIIDGGAEVFPGKDQLRHPCPPVGSPDAGRLDDFLIARMEGDLSKEQELQLARYLYEHPEAARQAALIAITKVPADVLHYPGKAGAYRDLPPAGMPDAARLTDFLVAEMEGDLSVEQQRALARWRKDHPEVERERKLLAAVRVPVQTMAYPHKQALRKRRPVVRPLWPRLAAAASIALVATAALWPWRGPESGNNGLAQSGDPNVPAPVITETGRATETVVAGPEENAVPRPGPGAPPAPSVGTEQGPAIRTKPHHAAGQPKPVQPKDSLPARPSVPAPLPEQTPLLAQQPLAPEPPEVEPPATVEAAPTELLAANNTQNKAGEPLGAYMLNTVRREVLDSPERKSGLDGHDAWAMADKALGWASQGKAGVSRKEGNAGDRVRVRFGKNFSISASTSR
jgi:hypothetical protein